MSAGVSVSVPVPCTDEPIDVNAEHAAAQQEVGERSHKRLRSEDGNSSGDGHTSNGCIDAAEDQRNKRQHGHHGHLRTHHAVDDEPDEEGANVPALASSSGAPAGTSSRVPNAVASPKAAAEAEATPNTLHAGGAPKTASNAKVKHQVKTAPVASTLQSCYWVSTYVHCIMQPQAQLSFADELEEDEDGETPGSRSGLDSSSKSQDGVGGGGGGGGLRAATANRFKQEKRAARQQQLLHQPNLHVFRRSDTGGGDDAAEAGAGHAHAAVAVVDDDVVDGEGPSHRSSAPTLGRIHFGAAQARGMRHYMEDRHCVVSSMQLLSNASGGGAQAGTPLPPDGVPRSYAAIFDGERTGNAWEVQGLDGSRVVGLRAGDVHFIFLQASCSLTTTFDTSLHRSQLPSCHAGHNGAGAAELAASRLHVLLAAHPALRMHTGELGPPAVAKSEEVAIGAALRSAFGQVDEATLAVARREGVRDGATALVVLRLGQVGADSTGAPPSNACCAACIAWLRQGWLTLQSRTS